MNPSKHPNHAFPPHLSMEEYIKYLEAEAKHRDYETVLRQKLIEERIEKPFRL